MDIEPTFAPKQREVQRKLGRCLMRLQQVELVVKSLWVDHEGIYCLGDTADVLVDMQAERKTKIASQTLGLVVKELTGSYLKPDLEKADEVENDDTHSAVDEPRIVFRTKHTISMSEENYKLTATQLRALVDMRNDLVHHFIERFDLWSEAGCALADLHLDQCYGEIDAQYSVMHGWAKSAQSSREATARIVQSDEFLRFLQHGILLDGTVDWATTTVVTALREAEEKFAQNGWTSLDDAVGWLKIEYPEEKPEVYGCSRWRHLLHESKLFQIRRPGQEKVVALRTFFRSMKTDV